MLQFLTRHVTMRRTSTLATQGATQLVVASVTKAGDKPEATPDAPTITAHMWTGGFFRNKMTMMVYPGTQQDILEQVAARLQKRGNTIFVKSQVFPYDPQRWVYLEKKAFKPDVLIGIPEIVVPTTVSTSVANCCAVIAAAGGVAGMWWIYQQSQQAIQKAQLDSEQAAREREKAQLDSEQAARERAKRNWNKKPLPNVTMSLRS